MKRKTIFSLWLIIILFSLWFPQPFMAENEGKVGFTVAPVYPENQLERGHHYFDLRVTPGKKQEIWVNVINHGEESIIVDITGGSASTNRYGVIDYQTSGLQDETMKVNFSDLLTIATPRVMLAAGESKAVRFILDIPVGQPFDGTVLGGLSFTKALPEQEAGVEEQNGVGIRNRYTYVIPVELTETDAVVLPDIALLSVQGELISHQPTFSHRFHNRTAAVAKDIALDIKIYREGNRTEPLVEHYNENVAMAPNSIMEYAVHQDGPMENGSYVSIVRMTYDGNTKEYEIPFAVGDAAGINQDSVYKKPFPWVAVLSGVTVLFAVMIVVLLRKNFKMRTRQKS